MRLLPSMNLIISCINGISLNIDAVKKLNNELQNLDILSGAPLASKAPEKPLDPRKFDGFNKIIIQDVSFHYQDKENIFNSINLTVNKGDFVGITGSSGSGKTTLVDLMMGLNKPTSGNVFVDDISIHGFLSSWRQQLAYLPQEIFLIDGTILENICIGHIIDNAAETYALEMCKKVGLDDLINSLPSGIHTPIGEKA